MTPARKKCSVAFCRNTEESSGKQLFKIVSNVQSGEGKNASKPTFFCEDHFHLPDDTENYMRYKYCPINRLKLRSGVLPHKNIPRNVCRICLGLINKDEECINISDKNANIIKACLPEIDLNITSEPVSCIQCFQSIESFYDIKKKSLKNEVAVVKCLKSVMYCTPDALINSCSINLFSNYGELRKILEREEKEEIDRNKAEDAETQEEEAENKPQPQETEVAENKLELVVIQNLNQNGGELDYKVVYVNDLGDVQPGIM